MISNLTGNLISDELCNPQYWRRQTREAVQFAGSIATALAEGYKLFLEVGPNATLVQMARHCEGAAEAVWLGSLRKGRGDRDQLLRTLGELYVRGARPNWSGVVEPGAVLPRAALPTYPFQRERYWVDIKRKKNSVPRARTPCWRAPDRRTAECKLCGHRRARRAGFLGRPRRAGAHPVSGCSIH